MNYTNKLKAKRVEQGITQTEIAKMLGVETCTYNSKELGKRIFNITELIKLLSILHCKFEDIFLD